MKFITTPKQAFEELVPLAKTKRQLAALQVLDKHIEMQDHKDKEAHWLFGKLWLYVFEKNLIHYKSSDGAMNSLRIALNEPMDNYFKLISDTFDHDISEDEVRVKLAEKINLFLNDEKMYN